MRTVTVHLVRADRKEVESVLADRYPRQSSPWIHDREGDPVLYINIDETATVEPEEHSALVSALGEDFLTVSADVSGRHAGDEEVAQFVELLLTQFSGFAADGYTSTLWALDDIRQDRTVKGHRFFDYRGWYADSKSDAH